MPTFSARLTPRQTMAYAVDAYCALRLDGEQPRLSADAMGRLTLPPPLTHDELMAYGLGFSDVQVLEALTGSRQHLTEVFQWVVDAHGRLEWTFVPNATGDEDDRTFELAHERALTKLSDLLRLMPSLEARGMESVRTCLKQTVQGVIPPTVSCWQAMADFLAAATLIHRVLASTGTFGCRHAHNVARRAELSPLSGARMAGEVQHGC